jgi:hypothetical protein
MTRYCLPALLLGLVACASEPTQTLEGRVSRSGFSGTVLGARVVAGDTVITTTPVDSDGSFTLAVPVGTGYRIEIITSDGAQPMVGQSSGTVVHFDVCDPGEPYDLGDIFQGDSWPGCDDPNNDGSCDDEPAPTPCDPNTGTNCCDDPQPDGSCGGGEDPDPGCDPTTDPNCTPGGGECDPQTGENCCTPNGDGTCTPCDPNSDPTCGCTDDDGDGICDGGGTPGCDPSDPNCCSNPWPDGTCGDDTCTDSDADNECDCDPQTGEWCGDPGCTDDNGDGFCDGDGTPPGCGENTDPTNCWPPPDEEPCDDDGVCAPEDCAVPEETIPDFGCNGG